MSRMKTFWQKFCTRNVTISKQITLLVVLLEVVEVLAFLVLVAHVVLPILAGLQVSTLVQAAL